MEKIYVARIAVHCREFEIFSQKMKVYHDIAEKYNGNGNAGSKIPGSQFCGFAKKDGRRYVIIRIKRHC